MKVQVGTPPEPGRYVVWTPCAASQVREWCEPSIATWEGGRWHTYDPVWGWYGPLPVVHGNDCLNIIQHAAENAGSDILPTTAELRKYDL